MLPQVSKTFAIHDEHPIVEIGYYLSPSSIFVRKERYKHDNARSAAQIRNERNLRINKSSVDLSEKSARRMRRAIEWLTASAKTQTVYSKQMERSIKFKVNFITLTLAEPQKGWTDKQIKSKILQPWLKRMAYHHNLFNYVWRAETQANGNIHFHIISDKFVHYESIRWHWNQILHKNGCLDRFTDKHGHSDPNSTDVHSIRKVDNIAAYLVKYFSKKADDRRDISGRQWGCSYSLSRANTCSIAFNPDENTNVSKDVAFDQLAYASIETPPNAFNQRRLVGEIFYIEKGQWGKIITGELSQCYHEHLAQIRNGNDLFFAEKKRKRAELKEMRKQAVATARALFNAGIDELSGSSGNYYKSKNPPIRQMDLFQS